PIGGILGPNLGGFIVDNFSWRWIFFINLPIGILLLVLGMLILPGTKLTPVSNRRLDLIGAGLFSGAVLLILYGMTNWANNPGNAGILTWSLLGTGLVVLLVFIFHENRVRQPMIELTLLKWRPFLAANIYNFVFGGVVFGCFSFIPYYATTAYGMTAGESGIILTPRAAAMIIVSALTSIFIIRFRYRLPMIIGIVTISAGLFLLSRGFHGVNLFGLRINDLVLLALLVSLGGIGMGIANPAANNAALDLIPEKAAAVAGLRGMFRATGGVFGTAVIVLILSHFPDKGYGMQKIFLYFSLILLVLIPLVFMIPDTARIRRDNSAKLTSGE
ncbi:MAG: MFS transporter, partial [Dehalococcoidales bacterium]|nr:MFS transporter [Dehalococcoidales bacterium]